MPKKKGSALIRTVTILLVVIIVGAFYLVFSAMFGKKPPIPAEKIAPVKREDIVRSVVAVGKIEPVTKVEIKSKASGIIQTILVTEGDEVKKGQVLLELDRIQLEAACREAEAGVLARQALWEKAKAEEKSAEKSLEKAQAETTTRNVEFAGKEYDRLHKLFDQKLIAQSQLDSAEQAYREEQVRLNVLKKDVLVKESSIYSARKAVHQAEADYRAAQAVAANARENYANATIRSPIDGKVLKRYLEPGDAVSSILQLGSNATLIMVIGDTRELYFKGDVDESDVGKVREGLPVNLKVETFRDKVFQGEVFRISPMGQEKENVTRFEIRVRIDGKTAEGLRTNMTANAELVLEKKKNVLTVPESAVIYDEKKNTFVDRIVTSGEKQDVKRLPVKTGIGNGARIEVLDGLKEGEQVVMN